MWVLVSVLGACSNAVDSGTSQGAFNALAVAELCDDYAVHCTEFVDGGGECVAQPDECQRAFAEEACREHEAACNEQHGHVCDFDFEACVEGYLGEVRESRQPPPIQSCEQQRQECIALVDGVDAAAQEAGEENCRDMFPCDDAPHANQCNRTSAEEWCQQIEDECNGDNGYVCDFDFATCVEGYLAQNCDASATPSAPTCEQQRQECIALVDGVDAESQARGEQACRDMFQCESTPPTCIPDDGSQEDEADSFPGCEVLYETCEANEHIFGLGDTYCEESLDKCLDQQQEHAARPSCDMASIEE